MSYNMPCDFLDESVCPICGKKFVKAPQHAWKAKRKTKTIYFCSYTCALAWDKDHPKKRHYVKGKRGKK